MCRRLPCSASARKSGGRRRARVDQDNRQRARQGAGTAVYAPEREEGQAREENGRRGRRGPGMRGNIRKGKRERGWTGATVAAAQTLVQAAAAWVAPTGQCSSAGGGGEGGSPPAGGTLRGAGARGAPAPSPLAPRAGNGHHIPVGDGVREDGVGAPGGQGSTAGSRVAGCGEREDRQKGAAQRRRGAAASRRESKRVGASEVDTGAARCRAGVRDK